jgi:hypothetical protein
MLYDINYHYVKFNKIRRKYIGTKLLNCYLIKIFSKRSLDDSIIDILLTVDKIKQGNISISIQNLLLVTTTNLYPK